MHDTTFVTVLSSMVNKIKGGKKREKERGKESAVELP